MYPIEADSTCDHSLKNAYGSRERASLQGNLALCLRRHAPQGSGVSPRQTASRARAGAAGAGVQEPNLFGILLIKQKAAKAAIIEVSATK